jgi:hypothetical protein
VDVDWLASTCALIVTRPPPISRTGITAELMAAVTPHWSLPRSATLESGTAMG